MWTLIKDNSSFPCSPLAQGDSIYDLPLHRLWEILTASFEGVASPSDRGDAAWIARRIWTLTEAL